MVTTGRRSPAGGFGEVLQFEAFCADVGMTTALTVFAKRGGAGKPHPLGCEGGKIPNEETRKAIEKVRSGTRNDLF